MIRRKSFPRNFLNTDNLPFLPSSLGDHHLGPELVELLPQLLRLERHLKLLS